MSESNEPYSFSIWSIIILCSCFFKIGANDSKYEEVYNMNLPLFALSNISFSDNNRAGKPPKSH